ncbi:type VI secretion system-associated protein TagF [Dechloromonas sp. ARDL1]|uniref:type VI secretion system-associated protein TagF n=1 Tax=Dechloromonas sp. ARDL1 TaxID=3322121 RepID=UPI003DA71721
MSSIVNSSATCFGKIPSRGDFVKGAGQHQLITVLDRWVSQGMERLSEDPRWKMAYDNACAVDFAFVGARSRLAVVGHLRPSLDSSGRRFPFIAAATIERDDALIFRCAPVGLSHSFGALAAISEAGVRGGEVADLLGELESVNCAADFEAAMQSDPLGNFVRRSSLESLATLIGASDVDSVRRIILAIGLLMRPALGQGNLAIDKEIVLPLPSDERNRNLVAGLWLYLLTAFLRRTMVELQFIIERRPDNPRLIIGFNGSSPAPLVAALSPDTSVDRIIPLLDPEWIEEQAEVVNDYGVAKLSAYLAQPHVSLEQAISTFREVFLGE